MSVQKLNQSGGPFSKIKWISETENDFVGRCPFCGDSVKNKHHAHFHVGKRYPVYHCFRCGAKGFIKALETFLNEHCNHEYVYTLTYDLPSLDVSVIQSHLKEILDAFGVLLSKNETDYFSNRCGLKFNDQDCVLFSLFPDIIVRKILPRMLDNAKVRTWAMTYFGSIVNGRAHDLSNDVLRYKTEKIPIAWGNHVTDDAYVIRTKYVTDTNTLVIAEGLYDIVPIYLRRKKYGLPDNAMYSASLCATYSRCLKVYRIANNRNPKEIIVFADKGIRVDNLRDQFKTSYIPGQKIIVKYPMIKDWTETGPASETINLF